MDIRALGIVSEQTLTIALVGLAIAAVAAWQWLSSRRRDRRPLVPDWRQRYPADWHEVRQRILERDANACTDCGMRSSLVVHHIVPLSGGGSNHPNNLRTLCNSCHETRHPHMLTR